MSLNKQSVSYKSIHQQALVIAKNYKKTEIELIEIIEKIERYKVFYQYNYKSLFQYVNQALGLSKEVTYIYINVARKTLKIPELKAEVKKGSISITKARRICSVINRENKSHWLDLAKTSSKAQLEKAVAASSPRTAVRDQLNYVHATREIKDKATILKLENQSSIHQNVRVQLQAGISEELMIKIRRAQDLVSQKLRKPASLEETLEAMTSIYIEKHDPLEKAKRQ